MNMELVASREDFEKYIDEDGSFILTKNDKIVNTLPLKKWVSDYNDLLSEITYIFKNIVIEDGGEDLFDSFIEDVREEEGNEQLFNYYSQPGLYYNDSLLLKEGDIIKEPTFQWEGAEFKVYFVEELDN